MIEYSCRRRVGRKRLMHTGHATKRVETGRLRVLLVLLERLRLLRALLLRLRLQVKMLLLLPCKPAANTARATPPCRANSSYRWGGE